MKDVYSGEKDPRLLELLEKMRKLGSAFQARSDSGALDYNKLAKLLCDNSNANVYVLGGDAKFLGHAWVPGYTSTQLMNFLKSGAMPPEYATKLEGLKESTICDEDAYMFDDAKKGKSDEQKHMMYVPIYGSASDRLGTVMLVRVAKPFVLQDIILAEYIGTLVGIEILHDRGRCIEEKARHRVSVQMAMRALSYSEAQAMRFIIAEIHGNEGVAIASKVADRVGVTRSVIVSALRKLESAGLIKSRSLGMKGTYIRVLSPMFVEELGLPPEESM